VGRRRRHGKKNLLKATLVATAVAFVASPLDDILIWSALNRTFLNLPWETAILLGTAAGALIYVAAWRT